MKKYIASVSFGKDSSEHVGVEELDARFEVEEKQQTLKTINP